MPDMAGAVALLAGRGLLPAIWFIFSRRDCELAATRIGRSGLTLCSPVSIRSCFLVPRAADVDKPIITIRQQLPDCESVRV